MAATPFRHPERILITGGCGFIGSAVVRHLLASGTVEVVNIDLMAYAASPMTAARLREHPRYQHEAVDICDAAAVREVLHRHRPQGIIHLAAETHVDRSIESPFAFVQTNVMGTCVLLDEAAAYWRDLDAPAQEAFLFHHISTDEVYGSLGAHGAFVENMSYAPNSPYAASKAAADHFVRAWQQTHSLPCLITNCSNNFGPYQFPEKLIPHIIIRALAGSPLPVYGKGENVRDWLYVEDHAEALWTVFKAAPAGERYNIGGNNERRNIDIVRLICRILDEYEPCGSASHESLIQFVTDRPGHDFRYAIDASKMNRDFGWQPRHSFDDAMKETVKWYLDNRDWWNDILTRDYSAERLGLERKRPT